LKHWRFLPRIVIVSEFLNPEFTVPCVSPNNLVTAVAEKRRVKVDKVNAVRVHAFKDFKIVAEDKAVYRHEAIGILLLAETAVAAQVAVSPSLAADYARFLG
jgi:hypothetical protein